MIAASELIDCANVIVARNGDRSGAGRLTLDRPERINALTPAMAACIASHLEAWANDDAVRAVVLDGNGARGFCAGGDIRMVRESSIARDGAAEAFWAAEYRLNAFIAEYPKPVVAMLRGIVMGGGVGLGCHARFRIVSETSLLAMPEVKIGFIPDVGSTYLLARAPRELGTYLALTGEAAGAADAIALDLADAFVPDAEFEHLTHAILAANDLSESGIVMAIDRFCVPAGSGKLEERAGLIECAFAHDRVEDILAALDRDGSAFARETAARIRANAPTAVKATLRALREVRANGDDLRAALEREFAIMSRLLREPDFSEGIRAQIVDKDRAPAWNPARLADVSDARIDRLFDFRRS